MIGGNLQRLAAAAHYVIARTEPAKLGAVKLNKILWYADLQCYQKTGRSLTGLDAYVRMPLGPVPYGIENALRSLKKDGKIVERRTPVYDHERREFFYTVEPDVSLFTPYEIDTLNVFIDLIKIMTAEDISRITHQDEFWVELEDGSPMPIGAASIVPRAPTESDLVWARSLEFA